MATSSCLFFFFVLSYALADVIYERHPKISPMLFGRPPGGFRLTSYAHYMNKDMNEVRAADFSNLTISTIDQKVDHFNPVDNGRWKQRYFYNGAKADSSKSKGEDIIFIMLGGEGRESPMWINNEDIQIVKYATHFGAHLFDLKHRFFGDSRPIIDMKTESLRLLTTEQALADLAYFITLMNEKYAFTNPKWVTFGGSYPGALSAFFRSKYPELTVGAVASSAPVNLALDFYDYGGVIHSVMGRTPLPNNVSCVQLTRTAFTTMQRLSLTTEGRQQLNNYFHLQPPFDTTGQMATKADINNFFANIFSVFQGMTQYTYDVKNNNTRYDVTVQKMCDILNTNNNGTVDPVANIWPLIQWFNQYWSGSVYVRCKGAYSINHSGSQSRWRAVARSGSSRPDILPLEAVVRKWSYNLLMAGSLLSLATINVRTLSTPSRLLEFDEALAKLRWDAVGCTESRLVGRGSLSLPTSRAVCFYSGGHSLHKGVAFVVRQHLARHAEFRGLSDRLATLYVRTRNLFLVLVYAPTSACPDYEYEDLLEQVEGEFKNAPRGSHRVLLGDFNGRVAREPGNETVVGPFSFTDANPRGRLFVESCTRLGLKISNTFFRHRRGRLWTWRSPNGHTKHQLDFICFPSSVDVINCTIVNDFHFDTDHRLVRATIRTRQRHWRPPRKKKRQLNIAQYKINASILGSVISHQRPNGPVDAYERAIAFTDAAASGCWEDVCPTIRISPNTLALLAQRHILKGDPNKSIAYSIACKSARLSLLEDIRRRKDMAILRAIEKGRSIVKAKQKLGHTRKRLLMADPTTGAHSQSATEKAVADFYNLLYTPTVPLPANNTSEEEHLPHFMKEELLASISTLKCGHSCGSDGVLPEMLKFAKDAVSPFLTEILNGLLRGEAIPGKLAEALVTLIFKKGDPTNISNFRPISLLSVIYKALTRTVLRRMESILDEGESPTQTGFRKGYSTIDNIHTVKQLIEKCQEFGRPIYFALMDFRKAFDTVEWPAVWTALISQGVHPALVRILSRLYEASSTLVQVNEARIPVWIRRGVRQGDTLSPKLFNSTLRMALDRINWEKEGINVDGRQLQSLEYADDVTIIAKNKPELEKMLKIVMEECASVGLEVNSEKTVLLTSCSTTKQPIVINGAQFNFVDSARYLGCRISCPMDQRAEIDNRIQCAWLAWNNLSHLLCHRLVSPALKKKAFDACIMSTVLYGCETWILKASDKERISTTQRKMERRMLGLKWSDKWSNRRVRDATGVRSWIKEATSRKFKWADRIRKMDGDRWARAMTTWIPYQWINNRRQQRPQLRWRDEVRKVFGPGWWSTSDEEWKTGLDQHILTYDN